MVMAWTEAQALIAGADVNDENNLDGILRQVLGTNLPWFENFCGWMRGQGLEKQILDCRIDERRGHLLAFISDHHPDAIQAPKLVQRIVTRLQRELIVHRRGGFPVTRVFFEGIISDEIREFVIATRGPCVHSTGITDAGELVDVMQPHQISEILCAATLELAGRRQTAAVCWCGKHETAEQGFQPVPVLSRCLATGVVRDAEMAIRAMK